MKKIYAFIAMAMMTVTAVSAQTFAVGDKLVSASVGFGADCGIPITLSYEQGIYAINEDMVVGVGGLIGYGFESETIGSDKLKTSDLLIAITGNYHYTAIEKFDLYAGLSLGYESATAKYAGNKASAGDFDFGIYVGARYYFSEKFAALAQLGYGISYFNIGATYKF
ncbi:MAG: outer membrane beta-barrel protein [Rikenellaceae bacterium]